MKLVTYVPAGAPHHAEGRAGVLAGNGGGQVFDLGALGVWAARNGVALPDVNGAAGLPTTVLALLQLGADGMAGARAALSAADKGRPEDVTLEPGEPVIVHEMRDIELRTPVQNPPSLRDFYVFEQHVKAARARRGVGMIPEWYEIPVFYFSNTSELYGTDEPVRYPAHSQEVDFELEMAAVIGREGRDISADDAPSYIAGYMVMND